MKTAWLRVAVNAAGLVTLVLVSYTAFFHDGDSLTGDQLMRHVMFAPAFALAAVAVALFWAHSSRFAEWGGLLPLLRNVFFWIAVALAIPTFVSILAAMFPLAGTEGQRELTGIHELCGKLLAGAGFLFAGCALANWWMRRQE
jgi:hypothetical protein